MKTKNLTAGAVLIRPHTTEKAFSQSNPQFGGKVYTFVVASDANKALISRAIIAAYGVTPVKIAIVRVPPRRLRRRGKPGMRAGFKKASVYLKEGDAIQFA